MEFGKQMPNPEKPEKKEAKFSYYEKTTEAASIAGVAAEIKETAGRVEAISKAVTEQVEAFSQALEDVKGLLAELKQPRETGGLGEQRQFAPLTDDELQNIRVIEARLHKSLNEGGQMASEVTEALRAEGYEDFAQPAQRIREDVTRWHSQTTVILSMPDEQIRIRIALSVANAMEAEGRNVEEEIDQAKKAGIDARRPVWDKMTGLWEWLKKLLGEWWDFVRGLMTPKEWTLKGKAEAGVVSWGSAEVEIKFGQ